MKLYTFVPKIPQQIAICCSMIDALNFAADWKATVFIEPVELNSKNDLIHYQLSEGAMASGSAVMALLNSGMINKKDWFLNHKRINTNDWFDRIQPILQMTDIIEK